MERYLRNIAIKKIGENGQKHINKARVLVCGCGGLGSGVISNLAAAGVGHLGLVDSDVVEISNLNRQFIHKTENIGKLKVLSAKERIQEINPEVTVEIFPHRLDKNNYHNIIKEYDLIVDCFDSYASKFLLNEIAVKENKPLIHGGVSEFNGQITVIVPHKTPCLRCIFPEPDFEAKIPEGNLSPVVNLVAAIEALEALKWILGIPSALQGHLLTIDALYMTFKSLKINSSDQCVLCS